MKIEHCSELLNEYLKIVAKHLGIKNIPELKLEESREYNAFYSCKYNYVILTTQWEINDNFYRNDRLYNPFLVIGHELVHAKQYESGDLKYSGVYTFYKDNVYGLEDRWYRPSEMLHEKEARAQEMNIFNACFPKFRDEFLTK